VSWNYRVIRHVEPDWDETFAIHEVYYNDDGEPDGCTTEAIIAGEDLQDLDRILDMMRRALSEPILAESDFDS